jgi:hypothetical protein
VTLVVLDTNVVQAQRDCRRSPNVIAATDFRRFVREETLRHCGRLG